MIEIKRLHGTDKQLYQLVAPLVMNPVILKQNYNYPFRTSDHFEWFVAQNDEEQIPGFMPVERKQSKYVINNYYVANHDKDLLSLLIGQAVSAFSTQTMIAIAFRDDEEIFHNFGFITEKRWTLYIKMKKEPTHAEN